MEGSKDCIGAIIGKAQQNYWIVGDVFMRVRASAVHLLFHSTQELTTLVQNVYSVFDFGTNQVGFAPLAASQ